MVVGASGSGRQVTQALLAGSAGVGRSQDARRVVPRVTGTRENDEPLVQSCVQETNKCIRDKKNNMRTILKVTKGSVWWELLPEEVGPRRVAPKVRYSFIKIG